MYEGVVNANIIERFQPITKDALTRVIRAIMRRSISAMEQEAAQPVAVTPPMQARTSVPEPSATVPTAGSARHADPLDAHRAAIDTTERELRAFEIGKAQFEQSDLTTTPIYDATSRKDVPVEIAYKDTTGYFGIQ
jgi:hypothetical protein